MSHQTSVLALTLPVLLCSCSGWGQVQLYTRPLVTGSVIPSVVGTGDIPLPTSAPASTPTPGPLSPLEVAQQTILPQNLRIVSSQADALTIEWSLPEGIPAHQYTALLNGQPVQIGLVGNHYTFTGLNPQTSHTLELQASFLNSSSTGSLLRPLKIVVSRPDTLMVEWGGTGLAATHQYTALLNGQRLQNGVVTQQQTFTLNLQSVNTLELQTTPVVTPIPSSASLPPVEPVPTPTAPMSSFPPPRNLRVVLSRPDVLTVEWDFADYTMPHSYTVLLNGLPIQSGVVANQYSFGGLSPLTPYTIAVQANSSVTSSQKVEIQTHTLGQGQTASGNFAGGGSSGGNSSSPPVITTAAPVIASFSPASGGAGTVVVLTGSHFTGTTGVTFNGVAVPSFVVNNATQITATLPNGVTSGNIAVTHAGGTATSGTVFTVLPPTIAGFLPTSGGSGTSVVITGTYFSGTTGVTFNGVAAASFVVNSATQITATTPTGVTSGNIVVTHSGGTATSGTAFTSLAGTANVSTLAGRIAGYTDGLGTAALFNGPIVPSLDNANNLYVVDFFSNRIRKIDSAGNVTTVAGSGVGGVADGVGTAAQFSLPAGIVVNSAGNIYVADYGNHRIRKIDTAGNVTTIAGSAQGTDDGVGTAGLFKNPSGIIDDSAGNLYVTDHGNHRIRKIDTAGNVTTIAGSPSAVSGYSDGAGTAALFNNPTIPVLDPAGNLYVTEQSSHRVRKIDTAGNVTTVAGSGIVGTADGVGTAAQFSGPTGMARDSAGNLYVVDTNSHRIRKISSSGNVTTLVGSVAGFSDGTLSSTLFDSPRGLAVDSAGNLYVMDFNNHRVRKILIIP